MEIPSIDWGLVTASLSPVIFAVLAIFAFQSMKQNREADTDLKGADSTLRIQNASAGFVEMVQEHMNRQDGRIEAQDARITALEDEVSSCERERVIILRHNSKLIEQVVSLGEIPYTLEKVHGDIKRESA